MVHMAHHHKEPRMLEEEVGIHIDNGVVASLHPAVCIFLHGKLCDARNEVGGVVFGEIPCIGAQVTVEHLGNLETQIQVGICIQGWQGDDVLMA